jgi:hypothetical protein
VLIAVNLGAAAWTCELDGAVDLLAASDPLVTLTGKGVELPPDSAAVVAQAG